MKRHIRGAVLFVALALPGAAHPQVQFPNPGASGEEEAARLKAELKAAQRARTDLVQEILRELDKRAATIQVQPAVAPAPSVAPAAVAPIAGAAPMPTSSQDGADEGDGAPACPSDVAEYSGWLPSVKDVKKRKKPCFLGTSTQLLSGFSATFSNNTGSAAVDVYRDTFGGFVDMTLSAQVDKTEEDGEGAAAVQRLVGNGGNFAGTFSFPFAFRGFLKRSYVAHHVYTRLAFDAPAVSGETSDPAAVAEVGLLSQVRIYGDRRKLGVFLEGRGAVMFATPNYAAAIGRGETRKWFDTFGLVTVGGGFMLEERVQLGIYASPGLPTDVEREGPSVFVRTTLMTN